MIPHRIQQAIKQGVDGVNVQLRLAIVGDDPETVTAGRTNAEIFGKHRRLNMKLVDEHGLVPVNEVLVYTQEGVSLDRLAKPNTLVLVAMINKNRLPEACVVLGFIEPDFFEKVYKDRADISGQRQPTHGATHVSTGP